jgi:sugar O-acyltransferase (sialic acid O-acetyltransferase NeuD family)
MKELIIIGAGGFGLEVAAYAEDIIKSGVPSFTIKGYLDDTKPVGAMHGSYPVLGSTDTKIDPECQYIIAVGLPQSRTVLAEKLSIKGAKFFTIIHPTSYASATAKIGEGSILSPFAFVGPEANIGSHCVLNIYASAGHESVMDDASVLSPYATLNGGASLGKGVFIGSHACVTAKVCLGDKAKLAAGSVAYNNIPTGVGAFGNPASLRKNS